MREAFCSELKLTDLNLANWNTLNVTDLTETFSYCRNLINFDCSNWNLNNVQYMANCFAVCDSLSNNSLENIGKALSTINAWDKPFNNLYKNNTSGPFYGYNKEINNTVVSRATALALKNNGWIFWGMNSL